MAMATLSNLNFRAGTDSGCSILILFCMALIITLQAEVCNAVNQNLYCSNTSYHKGSDFESNLNTVFNSVVKNTSESGFNTSVYGQSPDRVYGLLQCRGDATTDQSYNCSRNATALIRQSQNCGNAVGGRIWLDFCFLRYQNYNFIGQLDTYGYYNYYTDNNVSSPYAFNAALEGLLSNLSHEAAYGSSRNRYASGTNAESFPNIYALVQCTSDISSDDCAACLSLGSSDLEEYYYGNSGVDYFMGSCRVSYQIYSFFNSPSPAEVPAAYRPVADTLRRPPTPVEAPSNTHSKIPIIFGIVGGSLFLALLVLLVWLFTTRRILKGYEVHEQVEEDTLVGEARQIVAFKMETLVAATENFHDDNKLGEGGFGPVYKGTIRYGKEIAVKKLSSNSMQGDKEFLNEVNLVAKIQHRNLVKLLGCCAEGLQKLLVYEYLPKSSLDKILFDPLRRSQLDWQKRYNIILGVARGLLYLHEDSQPRIIHRDIKASNILLDEKLNPKIADFGLAKLFTDDESYSTLTKVAGTLGYMAPEYAMHGQLSTKADVYSFGVLLLEIVTGRKNTDYTLSPEMQFLLGWAWRSYEGGNSVEIIDPVASIESSDEEQAVRCIELGLWCTQADSSHRPPMSTVALMLSSHSVIMLPDLKPVFGKSDSQLINMRYSSSGCGLSHASATTSSASADLAPAAPPSIVNMNS